ncbi:hypothetical protein [Pseudorhodobacter turbinis]|uniref:hypothetical protein n=1 Tax=Pseudorhodobacter turbinis TaxID=2500533 RepID=UPI00143CC6E4|nr:hypothetical protein [Pseudorhodobacter turbinis]
MQTVQTIQTVQSNSGAAHAKDTERPVQQLLPYDLAGIRNHGSAASSVDWLRRVFRR